MPDLKTSIAQICLILSASYSVGWLLRRLHQPQVVGEMVAGILLGPSLLGWIAPGFSEALFPPEGLGSLYLVSQVGVLVFMFMVGIELDTVKLRQLGRAAVVVSYASIFIPFLFGVLLALYLYPRLADNTIPFLGFLLFMGTAMSITAFPVLARILNEQHLLRTRIGTIVIVCAAVDDVTAWCMLAVIIAVVRSKLDQFALLFLLAGLSLYVATMFLIARPILARLRATKLGKNIDRKFVSLALLFMLASALTTELIGIHALFGAFIAGVVMPKDDSFVNQIRQNFGTLPVALLLPLFFAFTGLRTNIGLIASVPLALYSFLVIFIAVAGKWGGAMLAARFIGMDWAQAAAIGILMNTRGLVELVILNIGLDLGVIPQSLFSMMVIMTIVTTLMTTPLLSYIRPTESRNATD